MAPEYLRYTCPKCKFEAEKTHCDRCDGMIVWDRDGKRRCTGCGVVLQWITCRRCSYRWNL